MDRVHKLHYTSSINGSCKEMYHITKPLGCCSHIYICLCLLGVLCKTQKKNVFTAFLICHYLLLLLLSSVTVLFLFFSVVLYWSCPSLLRLGSLLKQILND